MLFRSLGYGKYVGGIVVCVSCWDRDDKKSYTFYKEDGIDAEFLKSITDQYGTIDKAKAKEAGYSIEDGNAWLGKDVDVVVPAALEGQITGETVHQIHANVKMVAEAANGPTTPEADKVLAERGIFLVPDFLCNAGGVTVSYFEGVQNDQNFYWSREEDRKSVV